MGTLMEQKLASARIERFKENLKKNLLDSVESWSLIIPLTDEYIQAYREMIKELSKTLLYQEIKTRVANKLYQKGLELVKTDKSTSSQNKALRSTLLFEGAYELFAMNTEEKAKGALLFALQLEESQLQIKTRSLKIKDQLLTDDLYQLAHDIQSLYQVVFEFGNKHDKLIAAYKLCVINENNSYSRQYINYLVDNILSCKIDELSLLSDNNFLQNSQIKNSIIDAIIASKTQDQIKNILNNKDNALLHWLKDHNINQLDELKNYAHGNKSSWDNIKKYEKDIAIALEQSIFENLMDLITEDNIAFIKSFNNVIHKIIQKKSVKEKDELANKMLHYSLNELSHYLLSSQASANILLMLEGANSLYSNNSVNAAKASLLLAMIQEESGLALSSPETPGINLYRLYKNAFQCGDNNTKAVAACRLYKMQKHARNSAEYIDYLINFLSHNNPNDFDFHIPKINYLYLNSFDQDILFSIVTRIVKTKTPEEVSKLLNSESLLVHLLRNTGSPLNSLKNSMGMNRENLIEILENHIKSNPITG